MISTDVWIGSAPLYYAHAAGWLKEANIELLLADSIEDNQRIYDLNVSSLFTGTLHEYLRAKKKHPDLIPILIYDRSYGGDLILSNRTLDELKESKGGIDTYVEADTVGEEMIRYFLDDTNLSADRLNIIHRHLEEIVLLQNPPASPPTLVVTYNPHDLLLKQQGFRKIADSKNDRYLVVDAIYTSMETYRRDYDRLVLLKSAMERAHLIYQSDPHTFYTKIKPYLRDISYEEFREMGSNIRWIDQNRLPPNVRLHLESSGLPTHTLIR